ncbi:MAG: neutral/alkaline non-lysosomal ceramidase N-terminal domain-containing protein [Phycisphaerae bacterium]
MRMLCLALVALLALSAPAADFSVGVASVRITPGKPIQMAGYANRTKPFDRVEHDIYARALAIRDSAGNTGVLITIDICTLGRDVAEPVRQWVAQRTKVDPGAILINLSHTHSGPAISLKGEGADRGSVNPSGPETIAYTYSLQDKLVDVAARAVADLKPATLSWGAGVASFALNRRQHTDKGVILGNNPRGPVDRTVPVLRIDGEDGKVRAVVFGYACHGTTMPSSSLALSPDFPGYARDVIEAKFPGAESFFIAGVGGDANPYPRQQPQLAALHGKALGEEVCRVVEALPAADGATGAKLLPVRGPLEIVTETAALPLDVKTRAELDEIAAKGTGTRKADAAKMLAALDRNEPLPTTYAAKVSAWQFGQDLTLIALPNEVVVDYAAALERAVGPLRLWVAAYCHDVEGYIPSKRVLREGGYETRGLYIGAGWFAEGVEDALVTAAKTAAEKAGRTLGTTEGK